MKISKMVVWGVHAALGVLLTLQPFTVMVQQVPLPRTPADVPGPISGTEMTREYVQMLGRVAYLWGWPLVNMYNRRDSITKAPEPGLVGGFMLVAPLGQISMLSDYIDPRQKAVACPNQDVVYGIGFFALDKDAVVIQVHRCAPTK